MLAQTWPARRHPPALVYQPLLEGSYDPLLSFTSLSWKGATTPWSRLPASPGRELPPPDWRLQPSAPLRTTFHQFSHWIQQLQKSTNCRPRFIIFSDWTHSIHLSSIIHHQQIAVTQHNRSEIWYFILQQTLIFIRTFLSLILRIYSPSTIQTCVYFCTYYRTNFFAHTRFLFSKPAYIRASSVEN